MKIAIIAAIARNRVIGRNGGLPWTLPGDLKRFKRLTTGHTVVMGRKTFESIGKPLPHRRNVVISTHPVSGIETFPSLESALTTLSTEERIFIIGGGTLYTQTLPLADELFLTLVDQTVEGDVFFPEYASLLESRYILAAREECDGYAFEDYVRKKNIG